MATVRYLIAEHEGFRALVRALPVVFAVHLIEELAVFERFVAFRLYKLPMTVADQLRDMSAAEYFVFALVELGTIIALSAFFLRYGTELRFASFRAFVAPNVYLFGVASLLANAVFRVGFALTANAYVPGLLAAFVIDIPYAVFVLYRFSAENAMARNEYAGIVLFAMLLHLPIVALMLDLGRFLA